MGFEDYDKLHRNLKVKGENEMINYKEALSYVSPNFDLDDPIRSVWVLRKGGPVEDLASRMGASRMSNISRVSNSPSKISMKQLNDPFRNESFGAAKPSLPISKIIPESSPRQNTVATADSTVVNQ